MSEPTLTPDLVVMAISGGLLDDSLDAVTAAISRRRELLDKELAHSLRPGDCFVSKRVSPKKLNDIEFRFIEWDGQWLKCEFVNQYDRPSNYSRILKLRESHVGYITHRKAV